LSLTYGFEIIGIKQSNEIVGDSREDEILLKMSELQCYQLVSY